VSDLLKEDNISAHAEGELLMRSMRKVLQRRGLRGDEIEVRIEELLQKHFTRLAAIIVSPGRINMRGGVVPQDAEMIEGAAPVQREGVPPATAAAFFDGLDDVKHGRTGPIDTVLAESRRLLARSSTRRQPPATGRPRPISE